MTKSIKEKKEYFGSISDFHIEIDKGQYGFSLSCGGILGIKAFSDVEILLSLSSFSLKILGKGLCMTVFEENRVEIIGKIKEVSFVYGQG